MSQNSQEVTIPISEYVSLISKALLLEELVELGVEEWEHFNTAVENVNNSLLEQENEMQG